MRILITILFLLLILSNAILIDSSSNNIPKDHIDYTNWEMDWKDDFEGDEINPQIWSKIPRGKQAWNNTFSYSEQCYSLNNGILTLKGIVNTLTPADTAKFVSGGIYTKNKKPIEPGLLELKARFSNAQGAWPAIWLFPYKWEKGWPQDGEIDIIEHYNFESNVQQTVHTYYTQAVDKKKTKNSCKAAIKTESFNIYGIEIEEERLVFYVNGEITFIYPNLHKDENQMQFPFYKNWVLLIDMQLGGKGAGEVNEMDLPVVLEIDWVKHYKKRTSGI